MRGDDTKQQILAVALDRFRAAGYEATSLREIGADLAITKAAVYYHFPSKELLLEAVAAPFLADGEAMVAAVGHGQEAVDPAGLFAAYLDLLVRHRQVVAFLACDLAALNHPSVGDRVVTLRRRLRSLLTSEDAGLAERARIECALGALEGAAASFPDGELAEARPIVLDAALAALAPRPALA